MRRRSYDRSAATPTLADHMKELKNRLFILVAVLLFSSSLVYMYREYIIPVILAPYQSAFGKEQLMYLNPAGGFNFIFFISIYAGLAATIPIFIQQVYLFIKPTLPKSKQQIAGRLLLWSNILMIAGILFGYYIAIPGALDFLKNFATEYVSASLTADSYLHFLISYTVGLGLLFQFPLLLITIHHIKPLTPIQLLKSERWVIVFCMVAAAIITPTPDPVNMLIVAAPLLVIYQVGAVIVLISIFRNRKKSKHLYSNPIPVESDIQTTLKPATLSYDVPEIKLIHSDPSVPAVKTSFQEVKPTSLRRSLDEIRSEEVRQSNTITRNAPATFKRIERSNQTQYTVTRPLRQRPTTSKYIDGVSPMLKSV